MYHQPRLCFISLVLWSWVEPTKAQWAPNGSPAGLHARYCGWHVDSACALLMIGSLVCNAPKPIRMAIPGTWDLTETCVIKHDFRKKQTRRRTVAVNWLHLCAMFCTENKKEKKKLLKRQNQLAYTFCTYIHDFTARAVGVASQSIRSYWLSQVSAQDSSLLLSHYRISSLKCQTCLTWFEIWKSKKFEIPVCNIIILCLQTPHTTGSFGQIIGSDQTQIGITPAIVGRGKSDP